MRASSVVEHSGEFPGSQRQEADRQKREAPETSVVSGAYVVAGERFGRGASSPGAGVIEFSFRGEA